MNAFKSKLRYTAQGGRMFTTIDANVKSYKIFIGNQATFLYENYTTTDSGAIYISIENMKILPTFITQFNPYVDQSSLDIVCPVAVCSCFHSH